MIKSGPIVVDKGDDAGLRLVAALLGHVALEDLLFDRNWNEVNLIRC